MIKQKKYLSDAERAEILQILAEHKKAGKYPAGLMRRLAEQYGINEKTIQRLKSGKGPVNARFVNPVDLSEQGAASIIGTSTLYDAKGNKIMRWVKEKAEPKEDALAEILNEFKNKLPRLKPRKAPIKKYRDDLLSVIPMGDPHLGLFASKHVTGANEDFDLDRAESELVGAVDYLIKHCGPDTREAVIINLGDFMHTDFITNKTLRSGHELSVSKSWSEIIRVAIRTMRQCIESALTQHEQVHVINAIGNHDDHSAQSMALALSYLYEYEPRVTIETEPRAMHYYEFGKVMLAVTHGHSIKMAEVPSVAAAEAAALWGRTEHRFGLTGHIHHDSAKEYRGMKVESFRTLANRDHYAAGKGLSAGQDLKLLVMHREFGEVERHIVNVAMLRNAE
jgi:Ni,Fe-hydrogenase III component G